jgi:hypothetical protein
VHVATIDEDLLAHVAKKVCIENNKLLGPTLSPMTDSTFRSYIEGTLNVGWHNIPEDPQGQCVLTPQQQQLLLPSPNEHVMIAHMTPTLMQLSEECGLVFVNSEETPWLKCPYATSPSQWHKPDGFSCVPGTYEVHAPTNTSKEEVVAVRNLNQEVNYLFGKGIWTIRDCYHIVWEFKVTLAELDRGTAYKYAVEMSLEDRFNKYVVILGDCRTFFTVEARNGVILQVCRGNWTTRGSRNHLLTLIRGRNHWSQLLQAVCDRYHVTILRFLGSGVMGRCFACRKEDGDEVVIKTVLTYMFQAQENAHTLAIDEFRKIGFANTNNVRSAVTVVPNSLLRFSSPDNPDTRLGIAFCMTDVGIPMKRKNRALCEEWMHRLLLSLQELHAAGFYHGDARIENAIVVGDRIKWVDFLAAEPTTPDRVAMRADMKTLLESVFTKAIFEVAAVSNAIAGYPDNSTADDIFHSLNIGH